MSDLVRPLTLDAAVEELLETIDASECDSEIMETLQREATRLFRRMRPPSLGLSMEQRAYLV